MNFVYEHPTIAGLADYIATIAQGPSLPSEPVDLSRRVMAMQTMLSKYNYAYPSRPSEATNPRSNNTVVLLTGTTGSLGSTLLATFLESSDTTRVFAINRNGPSGESLRERQEKAFALRALDTALLSSHKLVLLEADFDSKTLGLDHIVLDEVSGYLFF